MNVCSTTAAWIALLCNLTIRHIIFQLPNIWDDELHNVVEMGLSTSPPLHSQDLSGILYAPHDFLNCKLASSPSIITTFYILGRFSAIRPDERTLNFVLDINCLNFLFVGYAEHLGIRHSEELFLWRSSVFGVQLRVCLWCTWPPFVSVPYN